jgi:hypothetical protein
MGTALIGRGGCQTIPKTEWEARDMFKILTIKDGRLHAIAEELPTEETDCGPTP